MNAYWLPGRRRFELAMVLWLVATASGPAFAETPAAGPLKLVEATDLVIDQMCSRCFDGTVDVLLKNDSDRPVTVRLTTTGLTDAARKPACARMTVAGPFDPDGRSGAITEMEGGSFVRAAIHDTDLREPGAWEGTLENYGDTDGTC